jgi:hypothetical protein
MKVIWTLKNSPKPHIHDNATEFPQRTAFNHRKFMNGQGTRISTTGQARLFDEIPGDPPAVGIGTRAAEGFTAAPPARISAANRLFHPHSRRITIEAAAITLLTPLRPRKGSQHIS